MTNKELQEELKQWPDHLEVRLGTFYEHIQYIDRKTVSINYKDHDIIRISDEEDFDYDE